MSIPGSVPLGGLVGRGGGSGNTIGIDSQQMNEQTMIKYVHTYLLDLQSPAQALAYKNLRLTGTTWVHRCRWRSNLAQSRLPWPALWASGLAACLGFSCLL